VYCQVPGALSNQPMLSTPCRFGRTSQGSYWNSGNGSPDAVCFSVDRPGVMIAGVGVYGGGGSYECDVELLDDVMIHCSLSVCLSVDDDVLIAVVNSVDPFCQITLDTFYFTARRLQSIVMSMYIYLSICLFLCLHNSKISAIFSNRFIRSSLRR